MEAATLSGDMRRRSRAHRCATLRQDRVDADGADEGALAGHVGPAEDHELIGIVEFYVVVDSLVGGQKRMSQGRGEE